ncbi:MAG: hypothetical protein KKB50_06075 [Planctomycetes bacterium]|nr:hypothetical protein [Planctomycetota bacterium]
MRRYFCAPNATDFDNQKRIWDGDDNDSARIDIGVDEFGSFQFCDLNCDGRVDGFDIDAFVLALTDPLIYYAAHPDCDASLGDLNGDGDVNGFDIDPFVEALAGK